jgi:hypothetical protein
MDKCSSWSASKLWAASRASRVAKQTEQAEAGAEEAAARKGHVWSGRVSERVSGCRRNGRFYCLIHQSFVAIDLPY